MSLVGYYVMNGSTILGYNVGNPNAQSFVDESEARTYYLNNFPPTSSQAPVKFVPSDDGTRVDVYR